MRELSRSCVHTLVGMIVLTAMYTRMWAWLCLHVYTHGHNQTYARILSWLLHPHSKPKYTHKSQNVCLPAEEIPDPATAHKKRVEKNCSISAGTWSCIHKHVFFCISGIVPPLGVDESVYVYVHVCVCLHLCMNSSMRLLRLCLHIRVGLIALMCTCTEGVIVLIYMPEWVWLHLCPHTRLSLITLMCECTCARVLDGVYIQMLTWSRLCVDIIFEHDCAHVWICMCAASCLCVHMHVGMITLTWIYKHVHMFMLMRTYTCGFCVCVCACVDMI